MLLLFLRSVEAGLRPSGRFAEGGDRFGHLEMNWSLDTFVDHMHPGKLTWNLKMGPWKRRFLLDTIFRFHVTLRGCRCTHPDNLRWFLDEGREEQVGCQRRLLCRSGSLSRQTAAWMKRFQDMRGMRRGELNPMLPTWNCDLSLKVCLSTNCPVLESPS